MNYGSEAGASIRSDEQALAEEDSAKQGCLRQNWCWVVRITLAIIGITVPLIMFLQPCRDELVITYEIQKAPLDLFLLLDGSNSMENDWDTCISAATSIISVFSQSDISELRIAAGQFGTDAAAIFNYTDDTDYANSVLDNETLIYGLTYYEEGLQLFLDMWNQQKNSDPNEQCILVMISDGAPTENNNVDILYDEMADNIRNIYNVSIMGIMVSSGGDGRGQEALQSVSSCDEVSSDELENCTWYTEFDDFETFESHSQEIANNLAETVVPVGVERFDVMCVKAPWLGFLALLIPLLLVLIMPYCISLTRHVKLVRPKPVQTDFETIDTSSQVPAAPPTAVQPEKPEGSSKYKWKIKAADHYIWGGAGGSRPLRVDWAGRAPPSAPKDYKDVVKMENMPLRAPVDSKTIHIRDLGNGYVEEEVIVKQTFEQWTEAKSRACWSKIKSICCCCCHS